VSSKSGGKPDPHQICWFGCDFFLNSAASQPIFPSLPGEMRWRVKCGDIMLDLKEVNLVNLKTQGLQGLQRPQRADAPWFTRSGSRPLGRGGGSFK